MSFIGSVGNLMNETGLADIMSPIFGGVHKMVFGKRVSDLYESIKDSGWGYSYTNFDDPNIQCSNGFMGWREGDWLLHVYCVKIMIVISLLQDFPLPLWKYTKTLPGKFSIVLKYTRPNLA